MDRSRVAIVIPAFNEALTIHQVLEAVQSQGISVVVDDGSGDETAARAAASGADVVRLRGNNGYDSALNAGFSRAAQIGCEFIVTMDADGQHDPAYLGAFLQALETEADVVVGVRDRRQRLGEAMFSWIGRAWWGIHDPLCGMKGYRMSIYRELGCFDSYGSVGTELAIFAARRQCRIANLPIRTRARSGQPRFGSSLRANYLILRALWHGIRRGYNY